MNQPLAQAPCAPSCLGNRRVARAVELAVRGTELLSDSNALLRRIAGIAQRTIAANEQYTRLLLDWQHHQRARHPLQAQRDRQASHDAAWRIARRATRAALDIGVLVDGVAPAWRRGVAAPGGHVTNLSDMALRILALAVQVERLARQPAAGRAELAALVGAMQGMRDIAQRNIQVARRSVASVERIQIEALRFARRLAMA